ncbi:tungsten ABC transporter substrate-binding protein [Alkaliphilus pronyensis]|uniref:Tungsten ABC transporter substrate-binding protein n=1 Tax=Alkaliphilus pronyensis TaxID=1482732 RepID=A0A6I0F2H4_9FIRM|nr:substrate-binding domain-containing protein [Alkaliphilus pronyensis]KAB3535512.1 tungsten ABC transporter substrate-binding protein [Alkaliphilus pronyensis]
MNKSIFLKACFAILIVYLITFSAACSLISSKNSTIILATTTSTENSGLLDYLLPVFTEDTGVKVKVVAVGTGQALRMGEDGDADIILAHAKAAEDEFVKLGHGVKRFDVMYNDFILIGPSSDPFNISTLAKNNILEAFALINTNKATFISRGDDSGTHKKELALWSQLDIEPTGDWYFSVGQGMGQVIQMANEKNAYTLADRGTYTSMKGKIDLQIIVEGDPTLFNQYGIIAVNPKKNPSINYDGAKKLIQWMLSEKGQYLIGEFGKEKYGEALFIPNGGN